MCKKLKLNLHDFLKHKNAFFLLEQNLKLENVRIFTLK